MSLETEERIKTSTAQSNVEMEADDSEDDFGDFEEVDQQEDTIPSQSDNIRIYQGTYSDNESNIKRLLTNIFNDDLSDEDIDIKKSKQVTHNTFNFDERAGQIFERLKNDQDTLTGSIIWKKTMIFKQLKLNLDIPLENMTDPKFTNSPKIKEGSKETIGFKDLYEFGRTLPSNCDIEKLMKQIPDFQSLDIDKTSDVYSDRLSNTVTVVQNAQDALKTDAENSDSNLKDELKNLATIKRELLELVSVWDEKIKDTKVDNDLFSSYVENIIGNTQKFRRINK